MLCSFILKSPCNTSCIIYSFEMLFYCGDLVLVFVNEIVDQLTGVKYECHFCS